MTRPLLNLLLCLLMSLLWSAAHGAVALQVRIEGISGELRDNVAAFLTIQQEKDRSDLTEARMRSLHKRAEQQIKAALRPFGYYQPTIKATLRRSNGSWLASYRITPGAAVRVAELDLQWQGPGRDDPKLAAALKRFPLRPGAVLQDSLYEQGKKSLLDLAVNQGYLDANLVRHKVLVYPKERKADVVLHIATGPRYYLGQVTFKQDILSPGLLQRYVPFQTGAPYSPAQLLALQEAVTDSDYFSRVEVHPLLGQAHEQQVPIEVLVEPGKSQRYSVGVGYGTDTGPRGRLGWQDRRINRRGHTMKVDLRLSQIKSSLSTEYAIPLRRPRTDKLNLTAAYVDDRSGDTKSKTLGAGVNRTHKLSNGWLQTLYLNFQNESFTAGATSRTSHFLIPGLTYAKTKANDPIYATRGYRVSADAKGAAGAALSSTSFAQATIHAKYIFPAGKHARVLLRGDLGATEVGDFDALPTSLRFFAGGDNSVRGYGYNELGPTDSTGAVIGGRYLLVGSVEYEHQIVGKWSGAVFVDSGNALNSLSAPLDTGTGVGVRWLSPVGLVRVDVALALNKPGTPVRLHVSIGPDL